jgi:peptidoglycan/LPS O-acetylase OafA/YrhL
VLYVITTTALTLGLAVVSWVLVEKPALRAFGSWERRQRALRLRFVGQG